MKNTNIKMSIFTSQNLIVKENRFVFSQELYRSGTEEGKSGVMINSSKKNLDEKDENLKLLENLEKDQRKLEELMKEVEEGATLEEMEREYQANRDRSLLDKINLKTVEIVARNLTAKDHPSDYLKKIFQEVSIEFSDDIINRIAKSLVIIFLIEENGDLSMGTGFAIDEEWILTNQHVVGEKADSTIIIRTLDNRNIEISKVIRVPANNTFTERDLALISTKTKIDGYIPIAQEDLTTNELAVSIGFGKDLMTMIKENNTDKTITVQSGIKEEPYMGHSGNEQTNLWLSMQCDPGDSGGPLLNENGELIGILKKTSGDLIEHLLGDTRKAIAETRGSIISAIEKYTNIKIK